MGSRETCPGDARSPAWSFREARDAERRSPFADGQFGWNQATAYSLAMLSGRTLVLESTRQVSIHTAGERQPEDPCRPNDLGVQRRREAPSVCNALLSGALTLSVRRAPRSALLRGVR